MDLISSADSSTEKFLSNPTTSITCMSESQPSTSLSGVEGGSDSPSHCRTSPSNSFSRFIRTEKDSRRGPSAKAAIGARGSLKIVRCAIVQPSYIPWRGYFDLIRRVDVFVFFDDVQYDRRGWRNRNRVKSPQGSRWLT